MKSTITFIFSLVVLNLSGQNIHHQMISSQGSSSLTGYGLIVNQTIGQQSITGSFTGSFSVQQGFQQSYWYNYLSNSNPILVSASPNPFQELIQFSISNLRNEKIGYKIREHSNKAIPIIVVIGKKEEEKSNVAVRYLGSNNQEILGMNQFIEGLVKKCLPPDLK